MVVELDWQAEEEDGVWECIAVPRIHPRRKERAGRHWSVWALAILVFAASLVVARLALDRRYHRALGQIAFQIQSVVDLEARALAQLDRDLYMSQQDETDPGWYARQYLQIHPARVTHRLSTAEASVLDRPEELRKGGAVTALSSVQAVEVRGRVAWVEVIASPGAEPVRQALFYRRTDLGWKHTAPQVTFWGDRRQRTYGHIIVRARERDWPYIGLQIAHISQVADDVCRELGCSTAIKLKVDFSAHMPPDELPVLTGQTLVLASPWLDGIPVDGTWGQMYLDELSYWTAYGTTLQFLRSADDAIPRQADSLTWLQRAIGDEYAFYYSQGDLNGTPILRSIIDRHGVDALPEAIRSLKHATASQYMAAWISPASDQGSEYAHGLLSLAHETARGDQGTILLWIDPRVIK